MREDGNEIFVTGDVLWAAPNQTHAWKKSSFSTPPSPFSREANGLGDGEEERESHTAKLYAKIGQLTVERDFSAKEARSMSAPI